MLSRREMLKAGGLWLAGLSLHPISSSAKEDDLAEILMRSVRQGGWVTFDPIGIMIRPGQRVRWINADQNVHTATAYHPANDRHPQRIPAAAHPWESGYLIQPGDSFEVRLTEEGIYDYFCQPHEAAGMVGRILVVKEGPFHPESFTPWPDKPGIPDWKPIPEAALRNFTPVDRILKLGRVSAKLPD